MSSNIGQIQSKGRSNRAGKAWALVLVNIDSNDHAPAQDLFPPII